MAKTKDRPAAKPAKVETKPEPTQEPLKSEMDRPPTPGERIRDVSHGFRVSFAGLSRTKTVKDKVQQEIADEYDADSDALRTIKKLIPSTHPAVKAVTAAKGKVEAYFVSRTLPFPEKGVRLFCSREVAPAARTAEVEAFLDELQSLVGDYYVAAAELDEQWQSVLAQAKREQGKLFDEDDYPTSVKATLQCKVYPYNVDIPGYYAQMSSRHYQEARQLLLSRFEEAARMQESVVAKAISAAVETLAASVQGYHTGEQKTFKNSVVENAMNAINEFNDTARRFGVGGPELAKAFDDLHQVLTTDGSGRRMRDQDVAEELRRDKELAQKMVSDITAMGQRIAELASVGPRRTLARRPKASQE